MPPHHPVGFVLFFALYPRVWGFESSLSTPSQVVRVAHSTPWLLYAASPCGEARKFRSPGGSRALARRTFHFVHRNSSFVPLQLPIYRCMGVLQRTQKPLPPRRKQRLAKDTLSRFTCGGDEQPGLPEPAGSAWQSWARGYSCQCTACWIYHLHQACSPGSSHRNRCS